MLVHILLQAETVKHDDSLGESPFSLLILCLVSIACLVAVDTQFGSAGFLSGEGFVCCFQDCGCNVIQEDFGFWVGFENSKFVAEFELKGFSVIGQQSCKIRFLHSHWFLGPGEGDSHFGSNHFVVRTVWQIEDRAVQEALSNCGFSSEYEVNLVFPSGDVHVNSFRF